jgi:hypothetical protein
MMGVEGYDLSLSIPLILVSEWVLWQGTYCWGSSMVMMERENRSAYTLLSCLSSILAQCFSALIRAQRMNADSIHPTLDNVRHSKVHSPLLSQVCHEVEKLCVARRGKEAGAVSLDACESSMAESMSLEAGAVSLDACESSMTESMSLEAGAVSLDACESSMAESLSLEALPFPKPEVSPYWAAVIFTVMVESGIAGKSGETFCQRLLSCVMEEMVSV